ncbi:unnamed protein product [Caenorhabditis auriculariae]|uniref:Katanin p80 subunit C-terminal domain-containing protein n=1 Tax=Caenorhabditis auriculariae TaxID=2777116 RepID=A0A8S1H390_9PELO|nr:unnamed protein product [Caenorhabditis auriculariae]
MVATTSNSLQLLTWEPCDILASMPLRGIDRVVSVSMNGDEMDLLCIGETTERLEMRTYSIEEVLSCSPRADFGERVVEDFSPLDEEKNLSDEIELSHTTSSRDCSSAELRSNGSHEREEVSGSVDSGSAAESSQSSPASPARIPVSKNRASSQKPSRTRAATSSTTTASKVPPRAPSSAAAKSSAVRSVRPRPSPSLSDLNKERKSTSTLFAKHDSVSNLGSTQSLAAADREAKKRSASLKRSEISITYMGRPRTPSESDLSEDRRTNRNLGTRTTSRNAPETLTGNEKKKLVQRTSSPVGNSHRPTKIGSTPYVTPTSPAKKPVRSKPVRSNKSTDDSEYSLNSWDDLYVMMSKGHEQIMAASQQRLAESRELRNYVRMRGAQSLYSHEVSDSESLSRAAIRHFNEDREWSLNACRAFLPIVKENLLCDEEQLRNDALEALQQIALGATDKLQKFANAAASSRIGVDVAAEERAEKALFCIEELRELCTKRDWYYRQMNGEEIERLDAVLGLTKRL